MSILLTTQISLIRRFKSFLARLWVLIKHPSTGTIIGIAGILIGIGFTIIWSLTTTPIKAPVYTVSSPYLVANTIQRGEKLKIFWDNKQINNVASVKIGIWNKGSDFIDKRDISYTNPIRIKPMSKVDILSVEVIKKSREELNFEAVIEKDKKNGWESIIINIKGDEALEKNDGVLFNILFAGSSLEESLCKCKWQVNGRIKGAPKGFQINDWSKQESHNYWKINLIVVSVCFILVMPPFSKKYRKGFKVVWARIKAGKKIHWL